MLFQTNILLPNYYHTFVLRNEPQNIHNFIRHGRTGLDSKNRYFGNTPLCLAAELTRLNLIPIFLQNGANRLIINNYNQTPLHLAANSKSKYFYYTIDQLISINTEEINIPEYLNMQDINGNTVLHILAKRHDIPQDFILYLIKKGANIIAPNSNTQTPLHVAAASGNLNMIKALLHKNNYRDLVFRKIYVNTKDTHGNTALHFLINECYLKENFIHLYSELITRGASALIQNDYKLSAIDMAKIKQQKLILIIKSPSVERELSQKLYTGAQAIDVILFSLNQIAEKEKLIIASSR